MTACRLLTCGLLHVLPRAARCRFCARVHKLTSHSLAWSTRLESPPWHFSQIINVDDNTVAFAHWGLGTMGCGASDPEELPDTVVSKKSRRSTVLASAGKTPGEGPQGDAAARCSQLC